MASIYTIEGPGRRGLRGDGAGCRRVKHGKKRGCTIALCPSGKGNRMKFMKGTTECK